MLATGGSVRLRCPGTYLILVQNGQTRPGSRTKNSSREKVEKKVDPLFRVTYEERNNEGFFYGEGTPDTRTAGRACRADALAPTYRDACRTTPRCERRTLPARCRSACAWRGPVRGSLSLRWYPAPGRPAN